MAERNFVVEGVCLQITEQAEDLFSSIALLWLLGA
jgi:hypothetical protein